MASARELGALCRRTQDPRPLPAAQALHCPQKFCIRAQPHLSNGCGPCASCARRPACTACRRTAGACRRKETAVVCQIRLRVQEHLQRVGVQQVPAGGKRPLWSVKYGCGCKSPLGRAATAGRPGWESSPDPPSMAHAGRHQARPIPSAPGGIGGGVQQQLLKAEGGLLVHLRRGRKSRKSVSQLVVHRAGRTMTHWLAAKRLQRRLL